MNPNRAKIFTLLGFAQKAGKLISGSNTVESMIGKPEAKLIILAEDGSPNMLKQLLNKCQNHKQRHIVFGTKDELGNAIGKSQRTVIVVKDTNLADSILKIFKTEVL